MPGDGLPDTVAGPEAPSSDAVPGDVVRALVARTEQEIERLRAELDADLRRAADLERKVRDHPAAPRVVGGGATGLSSVAVDGSTYAVGPVPGPDPDGDGVPTRQPRTVVNRRPRAAAADPAAVPAGTDAPRRGQRAPGSTQDGPGSAVWGWSDHLRSHLVVKAGLALVVVALLLLKWG